MSQDIRCARAMALATARHAGLAEADALRLEQHVAGCAHCREELSLLDHLGAIGRRAPTPGQSGVARRALARALAGERPPVRERPSAMWRVALPLGVTAAAAALLLVALGSGARVTGPAAAGHAYAGGEGAATGHAHATAPTRLTVAHGVLDLEPGTDVSWTGAVVVLSAGRVQVAVDPAPHRPFRVETARFAVHVTGTRFEVSEQAVAVSEGSVEVRSLDGELFALLVAGQRWELLGEPPAVLAAVGPVAAPSAAPDAPDAPGALAPEPRPRARSRPVLEPGSSEAEREPESARERFARAASLEATDPDAAARLFLALETEGGAWARNALFARASLALERGRDAEARALLERYLERHPDGPNAPDARALLDRD